MTETAAAFPRRAFLISALGFGSLAGLAAVTLPTLPALMRDAQSPLPTWASATTRGARAYHIALRRSDLLAQLDCYCGCMQSTSVQHLNLRDCFLYADGTLNPHAVDCGICQAEAIDAERWAKAGLSTSTIRDLIDTSYGGASCTVDRCVD